MKTSPEVSVIIPTYNRATLLPRAIDSVLNQTYRDFELLVIDDGSTDHTPGIIKQYMGKLTYIRQNHRGVAAARNLGIKSSNGKWIAFLDSDDYWLPKKLERQMEFMRAQPDLLISQTDEIWIRKGRHANPMKKHQKYGGYIFEKCLPLCIVSPSAVVINRQLFEKVGLFDENFPVCEDYDLWLRISLKFPIGFLPEKLIVKTGGHSDQLSKKFICMDRYRVLALEKILNEELTPHQRALVIQEIIKKLTILSKGREKHPHLPNIYKSKLLDYQNLWEKENEASTH